ncbi:Proteasome subunit beta type-1 [Mucor velutinosus]|uniref:Proteasome subunit beta type-1 n=1 Tax=Mucor velutinosus TaxID=708070 RepID=A0AAN7D9B2_9FUNG|nr:Proteasome subunit beta type-1 [Mucor velutinosus]
MELNGPWFTDKKTNRTVLFKGVNLSGGTKLPVGMPSHQRHGYWVDYDRRVSFVGRPFPLDEADEHLQRLVSLGFNLLRCVVTWEAIEHEGPGIYDQDYIDYLMALLKKCQHYGLQAFIDPHQDSWSRHCGGSGHPGWTLTLAGLNPLNFPDTNAAIVHNLYPNPKEYPKMIWNTNYAKLAAATLFTLFFAGKTFAPKCIVNGVHVQDYLQSHYINSMQQIAKAIQANGLENTVIIGYDTINEPGQGYLPIPHLNQLSKEDTDFKMGFTPTAYQGMLLGSGIPTKVENWEFRWNGPKKTSEELVNPDNVVAWLTDEELKGACDTFGWERDPSWTAGCIWALHGVWDKATQQLLKPDYFATHPTTGKPTVYIDYWLEHVHHYAAALRAIHPDAILFVQPPVLEVPPKMPSSLERIVYAPHWYDGLTLVKKKWCSYNVDFINLNRGKYGTGPLRFLRALRLGEKAIRQCFVDQLKTIQTEGLENVGNYPCILGEIGIPYDLEVSDSSSTNSVAYWWNWCLSFFTQASQVAETSINSSNSPQNRALDANLNALEKNLLNYTLWNYMSDNSQEWGDRWNGEDLSIFQPPANAVSTTSLKIPEYNDDLEAVITSDSIAESSSSSNTIVATPSSTSKKMPWNATDDYIMTNASTDSLQGLLQQTQQQTNVRNVISLHRPHPTLTAGIPISINYIAPTESASAIFEYTMHYQPQCDGPTEVYVPSCYFPLPPEITKITVNVGTWKVQTTHKAYWTLLWTIEKGDAIPDATLKIEGVSVV